MWVKLDTTASVSYAAIIRSPYDKEVSWNSPYVSWSIGREALTNKAQWLLADNPSSMPDISGSIDVWNNPNWQMLTLTYDGDTMVTYVNGVLDISYASLNGPIVYDVSNPDIVFGQRSFDVPGEFYSGALDDVRIYNRALSASEVAKLYQSNTVTKKNVSNNGLIGWWPLDEGAGTVAHDFSGKGSNGILTSGPTWASGKRAKAVSFDGTDDFVNTKLDFFGMPDFTVSQWIYANNPGAYQTIWSADGVAAGCGNGEGVYFNGSTAIRFRAAGVGDESITVPNIRNKWTHVVSTYNATNRRVYFDKVLVYNQSGGSATTGDVDFQIGNYNNCAGSVNFNGLIDDTRVYNRVLSADEINKLYEGAN